MGATTGGGGETEEEGEEKYQGVPPPLVAPGRRTVCLGEGPVRPSAFPRDPAGKLHVECVREQSLG